MALNINTKLTNNLDGYLIDSKNVKGTYVVVADYSELSNLPASCVVEGTLAYCQSDYSTYEAGFYQFIGNNWEVADLGGGVATLMTSVTYSQFETALGNSSLIPGMVYRITDYVTKIHAVYDLSLIGQTGAYLPYATSAEHPFDLLVTATGTNTYNENVKAMLHTGDTYFANSNLAAWELKWTNTNDPSKYSWADEANGKGVITWMKDEFGNEAWYDFKNVKNLQFALERIDNTDGKGESFEYNYTGNNNDNINRYGGLFDVFNVLQENPIGNNLQFKAPSSNGISTIMFILAFSDVSKETLESTYDWTYLLALLSNMAGMTIDLTTLANMMGTTPEALSIMTCMDVIRQILYGDFYYTFDYVDVNDSVNQHIDLSLQGAYCQENKIEHCADALTSFLNESNPLVTIINNGLNVITFENYNGLDESDNALTYVCYDNKIGADSFLNVFGTGCYNIKTGGRFVSNRLSNGCDSNTFGSNCSYNSLGYMSNENSFGNMCYGNVFGKECNSNIFSNGFYENSFLDSCYGNIFGNNCYHNVFGSYIYHNTIGNAFMNNVTLWYFHDNTFGSNCTYNSFGTNIMHNSFGNLFTYNTLNDSCSYNSFGNNCQYNQLGDNCYQNNFGDGCGYVNMLTGNCQLNTIGSGCSYITFFRDYCKCNIIENGVCFVKITSTNPTSFSDQIQNIKVCLGVAGSSSSNLLIISATKNADYQVEYKMTNSTEVLL